jgi:hypothetical protein
MECAFDCGATLHATLWLYGLALVAGLVAYRWPWTAIPLAFYLLYSPAGIIMHGFPSPRDIAIAYSGVVVPLLAAAIRLAFRRRSVRSDGPA